MRPFCVFASLWIVASLHAQFSNLTTTNDGSVVYFASSLKMRGTDQYRWGKIFRVDSTGATLVAQRAPNSPIGATNPYLLSRPQISGNENLLLYLGTSPCSGGSSCEFRDSNNTTLRDNTTGSEISVGNNAVISPNAKFLLTYGSANAMASSYSLVDRSTSVTLYNGNLGLSGASLASDGTAVVIQNGALSMITGGSLIRLRDSNVRTAVIAENASLIIYETGFAYQAPKRLFVIERKTNRSYQLGPDNRDSFQPRLSADGQWVEYLTTLGDKNQIFLSHPDGSAWQQLTSRTDGIVEATFSGDGKVVYALTGDGSLLKIDAATSTTVSLIGRTPQFTSTGGSTPGSLATLTGNALANTSISIAGLTPPILSRSDTKIVFQVPWETPLNASSLIIPEGGSPYFEDSVSLNLFSFFPVPILLGEADPITYRTPVAIHSDFSSLVTTDNPARPGETLHIYVNGGGPVDFPVPTGMAAPPAPLSRITSPVTVVTDIDSGSVPIVVPYFGLAPGLLGVWQMDFIVPPRWTRNLLWMQLRFSSRGLSRYDESVFVEAIPVNIAQ